MTDATAQPIFPLKGKTFDKDKVTLTNKYTQGNTRMDREAECSIIDSYDKEATARSILEFREIAKPETLHINANGAKLFASFRQICSLEMKDVWDAAVDGVAVTAAGFDLALGNFLGEILQSFRPTRSCYRKTTRLSGTRCDPRWEVRSFGSDGSATTQRFPTKETVTMTVMVTAMTAMRCT